jgi:putative spermidine/putrescine transport system permease protein
MSREPAHLAPWLLVGPALVLFIVVFAVPLLILFTSSFERLDTATFSVVERFTLFNYRRFLFDEYYINVLLVTLRIGLLVTLIALVTGYPFAMYLTQAPPRERSILMLLIISPLLVSVVIRTFGWVIVLSPKGLINWALLGLGILSVPLKLMYTETAVVIGLTHIFYPFMVLAIYTALRNIDPEVIRAAQSLGAGPARTFWQVTLPLSIPGVVAGSLIVFALSVSSFVTPSLLGGPWVKVAAYLAWEQNVTVLDWPFAAAISVILLLLTALIMVMSNRLVERSWFAGVFQ